MTHEETFYLGNRVHVKLNHRFRTATLTAHNGRATTDTIYLPAPAIAALRRIIDEKFDSNKDGTGPRFVKASS